MSRTVVTAILLEELYREGHEIRLSADALLTPAARDWIKEHPIPVTWDASDDSGAGRLAVVMDPALPELRLMRAILDRRGGLAEVIEPAHGRRGVAEAVRQLCDALRQKRVAKAVAFVLDGALPVCLANKYPGVRAALGMNLPMAEEAIRSCGANLLVLEYPTLTTYQMRQMVERLMAGPSAPPAEMLAVIEAVEREAGRADR